MKLTASGPLGSTVSSTVLQLIGICPTFKTQWIFNTCKAFFDEAWAKAYTQKVSSKAIVINNISDSIFILIQYLPKLYRVSHTKVYLFPGIFC